VRHRNFWEVRQKLINNDKLTRMSLEERAVFLKPSNCENYCIFGDCCDADKDDCSEGIKKWLESEAECER